MHLATPQNIRCAVVLMPGNATAMIDSKTALIRWAKRCDLFATVTVSVPVRQIHNTLDGLNLSYRLVQSTTLDNTYIVSILCR